MTYKFGDRVTYKFIDKDGIFTEIVGSNNLSLTSIHWFKEHLEDKEIEIIKIERPKYEVVEEKKELLTEEEKEFLEQVLKFGNYKEETTNGTVKFIEKKDIIYTYIMMNGLAILFILIKTCILEI